MGGGCRKSFVMRTSGRDLSADFYYEDCWEGVVGRIL